MRLSEAINAEAVDLVRSLAAVAGDVERVADVLEDHHDRVGYDLAVKHCIAALLVTFGECITSPVSLDPNNPVPVTLP